MEMSYNCQENLKMEEKNGFHDTDFTRRNNVNFQKFDFPMVSSSRKKCPNKRILFQADKKWASTRRNGEFV